MSPIEPVRAAIPAFREDYGIHPGFGFGTPWNQIPTQQRPPIPSNRAETRIKENQE